MTITNCRLFKKSIKRDTNLKLSNVDQLKDEDGIRCLEVVSIPCIPVTPTVCSFSRSGKTEDTVVSPMYKYYIKKY